MLIKNYRGSTADMTTALWVSFWAWLLTLGDPDLLDAIIHFIGRQ